MKGASVTAPENTLTLDEIAQATQGRVAAGRPAATVAGVSIDSRTLAKGQLFVAVKGPNFDGHDFVGAALARGAAAAMVHREVAVPDGFPLVRVGETTQALKDLGRHVRMKAGVPVVAVTGSAGKTTTKEMTAALL
ncbi:MAG TPA: Mur ligase domain-containing protein, partial [Vicinamibacteria bacterium]|nr:Mur ligase domain-containing protein [Vicinamibacteria bacterium]